MTDSTTSHPDPLVAALPPATDYITYLTLLEYQLTPQNLPTLSRLLQEDDGSLAQEIGWDLLKLILPMLGEVPDEAVRCLEIIARRGNPREVVVKIAEQLESLGANEDEAAVDFDALEDEDELRTFDGEAERIHLGNMTLDGMAQPASREADSAPGGETETTDEENLEATTTTKSLEFGTLLNMLGILHPRIKTQYPSRFLATSLPAALRAYRRTPITTFTTSSFLAFLSKLCGKQRPALPPRTSMTTAPTTTQTDLAPLPDPEAITNTINTTSPSDDEKAITQRLLQAVMLEVVEEFASSLRSSEIPSFSWTTRLREVIDPARVFPGRPTETQRWKSEEDLSRHDALMAQCLRLANDINLDTEKAFQEVVDIINGTSESKSSGSTADADADSPSEFPKSPSEIPFSQNGVIMLFAASHFVQQFQTTELSPAESLPPVFPTLSLVYLITRYEASRSDVALAPALADAILSLLYMSSTQIPILSVSPPTFIRLVADLASLSATFPEPQIRDSAHAVATKIYHGYPIAEHRLRAAREIIEMNNLIQVSGADSSMVVAVVVDWVKDEMLTFLRRESSTSSAPDAPALTAKDEGIDPQLLDADEKFQALLFAPLPILPSSPDEEQLEAARMLLQMQLPALVSELNLFCVLRARTSLRLKGADDAVGQTVDAVRRLLAGEEEVAGWAWALEDATGRAAEALKGTG